MKSIFSCHNNLRDRTQLTRADMVDENLNASSMKHARGN